jgi:trans-aconitate methyltransferase
MDYSRFPDLDEEHLTTRVDVANAALQNTEFDVTPCMVGTSPAEAEAEIRDLLANQSFDLVMVGGAVRAFPEHTLLFERIVNVIVGAAPGIRFCFNTSPETSLDALRRAAGSV